MSYNQYNPYYPYYQWGQDRFANRPSAYIRPGVVDWRSPGRNYPGYDPYDTSWTAAIQNYQRRQQYYHDSAARLRPNDITAWAEQLRGWR
ncbi:hypothetical protein PG984_005308 [Apiospora sp. TS-2023a]